MRSTLAPIHRSPEALKAFTHRGKILAVKTVGEMAHRTVLDIHPQIDQRSGGFYTGKFTLLRARTISAPVRMA